MPKRENIAENMRRLFLTRAGIAKGRLEWTWETLPGAAAREALPELREHYAVGDDVLIVGSCGTGKTGLLVGAVRHALDAQRRAAMVLLPMLLIDLNDCYREASRQSRGELLRQWYGPESPDFLGVDDLGAELRESDAVKADVWLLLETRRAHGKQTWITSNLTPAELQDRYDQRSYSRLQAFRLVVVDGEDERRPGRR